MTDVKPRPTYRQRQAQETRARIASAARKLFGEKGYAATPIDAIAAEVGVAVRTVYAAFGTKKAILGVICEQWLEASETMAIITRAGEAADGRAALALIASASRRQWEAGADILAMLNSAAALDPEVAELLREWSASREAGMVSALMRVGPRLRQGLDYEKAGAIIRAISAPAVYTSLVSDSGWNADAYEAWLAATLETQLLERGTG